MSNGASYRWWPSHQPVTVENDPAGVMIWEIFAEIVLIAILCIPLVRRATGLAPVAVISIIGGHMVCGHTVARVFVKRAATSRAAFHAQVALELFYNTATAVLLVAFTGDPRTPLWLGVTLYACLRGAQQEFDASLVMLIFLALAPLATIPLFLAAGVPSTWAVGLPVVNSVFCALGYHLLAMRALQWRKLRKEQAAEIERLRVRSADLERQQLARDLHDSVGSALSLVGMYGDLVVRHRDDPEGLLRIATTLREATHAGLGDLRGVLDAMAPDVEDFDALTGNLRRIGERVTAATGVSLALVVEGLGTSSLSTSLRLGLVRLFQEAVHNAVRHGRPRTIDVRIALDAKAIMLEVTDDGVGFDALTVEPGRGLLSMRARAKELGGELVLGAVPGQGTQVRVDLPREVA